MIELADNAHDIIFTPAALKLGEIHWWILKAATLMEAKCFIKPETGRLSRIELTEFGRQVGRDEIHWWVFEKETNLSELQARTARALDAAQALKESSAALKRRTAEAYDGILVALRDFVDGHVARIDVLHDYVRWLSTRDVLAPTILFNYRVWGSTRMSDRWVEPAADAPENETAQAIR